MRPALRDIHVELADLNQESVVLQKEARHHIGELEFVQPSRSMSCIGG